ncbi:hypothetical protein ONS95_012109 [Cadophora gregata]|uniref:uncharacterized protein n=1 Tax=Cadophora gregata TaxID=51156 RepID=UPI0026DC8A21|nr:uncharacterized protein ONS95_012109 [Cadophora gregata]KAK0117784.1 hypothetical protein ONS95_012109 [Cadophora gregata]KAK0122834.1 hypothetical protein ONS96_009865 [Cadophora gregata f. sp. sojae]
MVDPATLGWGLAGLATSGLTAAQAACYNRNGSKRRQQDEEMRRHQQGQQNHYMGEVIRGNAQRAEFEKEAREAQGRREAFEKQVMEAQRRREAFEKQAIDTHKQAMAAYYQGRRDEEIAHGRTREGLGFVMHQNHQILQQLNNAGPRQRPGPIPVNRHPHGSRRDPFPIGAPQPPRRLLGGPGGRDRY